MLFQRKLDSSCDGDKSKVTSRPRRSSYNTLPSSILVYYTDPKLMDDLMDDVTNHFIQTGSADDRQSATCAKDEREFESSKQSSPSRKSSPLPPHPVVPG